MKTINELKSDHRKAVESLQADCEANRLHQWNYKDGQMNYVTIRVPDEDAEPGPFCSFPMCDATVVQYERQCQRCGKKEASDKKEAFAIKDGRAHYECDPKTGVLSVVVHPPVSVPVVDGQGVGE